MCIHDIKQNKTIGVGAFWRKMGGICRCYKVKNLLLGHSVWALLVVEYHGYDCLTYWSRVRTQWQLPVDVQSNKNKMSRKNSSLNENEAKAFLTANRTIKRRWRQPKHCPRHLHFYWKFSWLLVCLSCCCLFPFPIKRKWTTLPLWTRFKWGKVVS